MPAGSNAFIQLPADGAGKRSDAESSTIGGSLVHRVRNVPYQGQIDASSPTTILSQATPAASTTYTSGVLAMLADGYNGVSLLVKSDGTNSTNVMVKVYPSFDGVNPLGKAIDEFVVQSPRAALKEAYAVGYFPWPYLVVKVITEATAPTGGAGITVQAVRHYMASLPLMGEDASHNFFSHHGSAKYGEYRGIYTFDSGALKPTTYTAGQAFMAIWNPATSPVTLMVEMLRVWTQFDTGTAATYGNIHLEGVRVTADPTGIAASTAEKTNSDFLAPLATYRASATMAGITVGSYTGMFTIPVMVGGRDFYASEIIEPRSDLYEILIPPGEGLAIRVPNVVSAFNMRFGVNMIVAEEM